jgi:glyoxylase-like metal-dependent hydrolase (beta-lactamase superfamily II)
LKTPFTYFTRAVVAAVAMAVSGLAAAQSQTDIHRDAGTRNALGDAFLIKYARAFYCNLADDNNGIVIASRGWNNQTGTGANAEFRIPLMQIFDDVWFLGNHYVGQYMIKTPDGIVQLDSGNTAAESTLFHDPALASLGVNNTTYRLKAVLLTHGHGDHDGGAKHLKDTFGAEIFLGSADAAGKSYAPTTIDSTNLAMRQVSIGGKNVWVLPTPGHTPGSTSAVLEVQDHGVTRRVLMNGGQSMTSSIPAVQQYLASIERTHAMVRALDVDGVMTPHIYWDGEGEKIRDIQANGRSNPSQHIYGHEAVLRQMAIARECSAAWLTRLDATAVINVWRHNVLEFVPGSPTVSNLSAKLYSGWGPTVNQTVTFSTQSGASCSAKTNADGVASCAIRPLRPHQDKVTASFAGAETAEFVDLPATSSTATVCDNGNCNAK